MGLIGRPSKYKATVKNLKQIERMAAKGFTNMDFADVLGVNHSTIDNWLAEHPEFFGSIKRGRDIADAKVEKSLFQRALGYKHKAVKIMTCDKQIVREEYTEQYPPDTMAGMYWLNNRKPREWRHKQTIESVSGVRPLNIHVSSVEEKGELGGGLKEAIKATEGAKQ